jgi:hypothetical protein
MEMRHTKHRITLVVSIILIFNLLLAACSSATITPTSTPLPPSPTATVVVSPTPVPLPLKTVFENLLKAGSFKAVTTNAANSDKVSQTYVAPDRLATVTETKGIAIYFAAIGKQAYISDDGKAWRTVEKAVWTVEAFFRLVKELSRVSGNSWTALADEPGNIGVAQLKNYTVKDESFTPQTPINITAKYAKTKLQLLELTVSDEKFSQKTIYSDFDSPNNKVEVTTTATVDTPKLSPAELAIKVFEATRQTASYKIKSNDSNGFKSEQVFVAPNRLAVTTENLNGNTVFVVVIGDNYFNSLEGKTWNKSKVGNVPGFVDLFRPFREMPYPPDSVFAVLPDEKVEGKTLGVFSVDTSPGKNPEVSRLGAIKATLKYDKQSFLILFQTVTTNGVTTEQTYLDYNNPNNKVEEPK